MQKPNGMRYVTLHTEYADFPSDILHRSLRNPSIVKNMKKLIMHEQKGGLKALKEEDKKFGWERSIESFEELEKVFKIENGKITAWWCFDCKEWIEGDLRCSCGTVLSVSQYTSE